jgi:hypothetical protein
MIPLAAACDLIVVVGSWECAQAPWVATDAASSDAQAAVIPWSTGFERGFCDHAPPQGFCYSPDSASYRIVTSPVHPSPRRTSTTSPSPRLGERHDGRA